LHHGDEIALADLVVLRVDLSDVRGITTEDRPTLPPPGASRPRTQKELGELMKEEVSRQKLIDEFRVHGSFVDIDVVGSYQMKADAVDAAHIIVSFENFREFVEDVINEFGGQVLNSNGDELMCFFESTHDAVRSASAVLSRLEVFNTVKNELESPFRFRIGAHTGTSLVDRKKGVAYSSILDIAGHLQKDADVNGLLISQATFEALPDGLPFEPAGKLERENIPTYRMTAPLE
jgi:class 3 adenylate cyclase